MRTLPALLALLIAIGVVSADDPCHLKGICYALDNSGSVSGHYHKITKFTVDSARTFAAANVQTKYSASWFNHNAGVIQAPTTNLEGVFVPRIQADTLRGGGTNIYRGLESCYKQLKGDAGARVIVVITDGVGASNPNPLPDIVKDGIAVVSVGVGDNVDEEFLKRIATKPEFYIKADVDDLPQLLDDVKEAACDAVETFKCAGAYASCDFTFEGVNSVPTYDVSGDADKAFTPRIVHKKNMSGRAIGVVNSQAGEFEPIFADTNKPISSEGNPKFAPTAFKTYSLKDWGSGIGHQTLHGDQLSVADDRCVVVFFQSWQVLDAPDGVVVRNVNLKKKKASECVAFKTST